jgi:alkylation response protein AidB-like acyl-CoA dehydrogenase
MKFYAGMEPVKLAGEKTPTGYRVNGTLPFVSNLTSNGWFGVVFQSGDNERVMALVPCGLEGLRLTEVQGFLGLNGTATCSCQFQNMEIPQAYILTENADEWIAKIRPSFLLTQVGLSLGLTRASLDNMFDLQAKQNEANRFLKQQPEEIEKRLQSLADRASNLADNPIASKEYFKQVVAARLDSSYLAMDATQAEMLHAGAAGYVAGSPTSRRLREALFIAVVTPAVKQLEKMLKNM